MAQLHAQESPERVIELEEWGALFDRTDDGLISQRDFGHRYARLAHVGDRTGLEMIRTLQQRAVALGIDVYMECTVTDLLKDGDRISGAFAYWREPVASSSSRHRRSCSPPAGSASPTRSPATPGSTPATGMRWRCAPGRPSSTWSSSSSTPPGWSGRRRCAASSSPSPCAATVACCATPRASASCSTTSRSSSRPRRPTRRRRTVGTATRPTTADHPSCFRVTRSRAINSEIKAGRGSPHGGVFLDIASRRSDDFIKRRLPSMYHQFKGWRTSTSRQNR